MTEVPSKDGPGPDATDIVTGPIGSADPATPRRRAPRVPSSTNCRSSIQITQESLFRPLDPLTSSPDEPPPAIRYLDVMNERGSGQGS
jgi:hypothetical protein